MRAARYHGPGEISIDEVPDPTIESPTDAVVRVTHTAVCGSDLWFYRGESDREEGSRVGHEPMGIVEEVGDAVRHVRPGDRVFAPFSISCGACEYCRKGVHTSCENGGFWGSMTDGAQGEQIRVPQANGTLVRVPDRYADDQDVLQSVLPLTDVMCTGHHAAVSAGVKEGSTCAVVGDGAVGLCAVLAARRLGANRIVALGHHEDRLEIAESFGATDTISARGEAAVEELRALTAGGVDHAMECVGMGAAMETAIDITRPGGTVGYVGVPHGVEDGDLVGSLFGKNVTLAGGVAPVRAYVDDLLEDVLQGTLDPAPVFTKTVDLNGVPEGYRAMDEREAIKVFVDLT
ncbi:zinc-dependent alcohol dehydrogenase family protein [Halomicroarcula sp. GCM10025709]|uniref:zinc-dependent alcohol dehydrogenase family protein n=1 Tax=Haloarcula TaxID=2237 RepID=UPI0024C454C9|nr:zinc-dependent alcohol dehydrogenase family protein [Halomicroarcula sp. YJ-61-S]